MINLSLWEMYLKSGISNYMTKFQLYTQHCIQRKLLILGIYTFKTRKICNCLAYICIHTFYIYDPIIHIIQVTLLKLIQWFLVYSELGRWWPTSDGMNPSQEPSLDKGRLHLVSWADIQDSTAEAQRFLRNFWATGLHFICEWDQISCSQLRVSCYLFSNQKWESWDTLNTGSGNVTIIFAPWSFCLSSYIVLITNMEMVCFKN